MMRFDYFLEYGHFVGKTGEHINAKLRKERLFDSAILLDEVVGRLSKRVTKHTPDVIVSQESHGAILARNIGARLNIPVIIYTKDGAVSVPVNLAIKPNATAAIVEDNIVTGSSVLYILGRVKDLGLNVRNIFSVFSSTTDDSKLNFKYTSLLYLPIVSSPAELCSECEEIICTPIT